MAENLSCEDCGKWFKSAGALRLHRYADHGVTERDDTVSVDAIPEPVSPRVTNQQPGPGGEPDRRGLPNPRRRLMIGAGVVIVVAVAVVGALWVGGYIGPDDRPTPVELPACTEPDAAKIDQLQQEWALHSANFEQHINTALGANDTARVEDLRNQVLQANLVYESAMTALLACQDTSWEFTVGG